MFAARFREGSGNCFAKRRSRFNVKGLTAPANGSAEAGCVSHTLWLTLPQYPPHKDTMTFCCRGGREHEEKGKGRPSYRPISGPTVLPMFAVPVFMSYSPAENTSHRKMWSKILGDVVTPRFSVPFFDRTAELPLTHRKKGRVLLQRLVTAMGLLFEFLPNISLLNHSFKAFTLSPSCFLPFLRECVRVRVAVCVCN